MSQPKRNEEPRFEPKASSILELSYSILKPLDIIHLELPIFSQALKKEIRVMCHETQIVGGYPSKSAA